MSTMKLKVLSKTGQTLMTCNEDTEVSLVYTAPYQPGDFIALTLDHPGQYCVVQFEDTMQPVLAYIAKPEVCFTILTGEQAITYSPKSFTGSRHVIRHGLPPRRRSPSGATWRLTAMIPIGILAFTPTQAPMWRPAARRCLPPAMPSTVCGRTLPTESGRTRAGASTGTPTRP